MALIVRVSQPTQEFLAVYKETAPQQAENVRPKIQQFNIKYQKDIGWVRQTQQFIMV